MCRRDGSRGPCGPSAPPSSEKNGTFVKIDALVEAGVCIQSSREAQGRYFRLNLQPLYQTRQLSLLLRTRGLLAHLTQSVFSVVLQKSTPPQIRQLIVYDYRYKE